MAYESTPRLLSWRWGGSITGIALAVFALDQAAKALAVNRLASYPFGVNVIGDFLKLTLSTNTGGAFGVLQGKTIFFTIVALAAIPFILYLSRELGDSQWVVRLTPGLLLGGAVGNLVDRIRLGYVVDFIDVGIGSLRWPTFNVADSAFVVGTAIIAIYFILGAERARDATSRSDSGAGGGGPAAG
ncbi:MAG: signal peptidase II [Chloroflexi bacterium]|nr:signal peptidase II [Chloroflexota bacterium]